MQTVFAVAVGADFPVVAFGEDGLVPGQVDFVFGVAGHAKGVDCLRHKHPVRGCAVASGRPRFVGNVFVANAVAVLACFGMADGDILLQVVDALGGRFGGPVLGVSAQVP